MAMGTAANEDFAAGASAALNKSIKEIERILKGARLPLDRPLREKFRDTIRDALQKASLNWYKIGFKRGHKTSFEKFRELGSVPQAISKRVKVRFKRFGDGQPIQVQLRCKIRKSG